ncbi:hypothetical protein Ais01nite_09290 [Asanoa ishikariensis]|uniref:Uncharacterized protein n=1 Tax=Asanoa ishikariensis TaxID=137265 RepID=A0A1H3T8U5_9ACTN|nr:hypothetical protein [Asanoa ishikariensis]GIF62894.1 hypothetical protein Ais01nite_09290 [Asanoa ishikariensis]SDZ46251.1 hypothetical protein SAMN05421684_5303 [Asanoa ishikariensis]
MAAARTAVRGLSTDELSSIRDGLAAGRKPKVVFTASAGQIEGQTGQVIELTDPDASDEFVVVRFGRDELPFSPIDLAVAPRGAAARSSAAAKAAAKPVAPVDEAPPGPGLLPPTPAKPSVPAPREESTVTTSTVEEPTAEATRPAKRPAKAARPKGPAGLTVTLAYADGEWTVAAAQGTKSLAKPYTIRPAEALKMVALVDVPGVHEAVEQIMASERAEAETQAVKLRAELAEIEARLAELRDVG